MQLALPAILALTGGVIAAEPATGPLKPVRIFLLAGQSNMEGKAKVALMDFQASQPATEAIYRPFRKDGRWVVRDDVWVKFLDRKGPLTVGFGSPGCIGPELGFGVVVGDRYAEQVLLIKTAWGGRSLFRDFRPPSAGLPASAVLDAMLRDLRKRNPAATADDVRATFGASYRAMLAEVTGTLRNLKDRFPGYAGQGYELDGLVWFQGWNDMISPAATAEYAENLVHLIRDVRRELGAPNLPFLIGEMGIGGDHPDPAVQAFRAAQVAATRRAEFRGSVALVPTAPFWDAEAEAVFKRGWREHLDEWNRVGSDYPYHYLGSARTMLAIGRAFGEAVLELRGERNPQR
jgi:alpha-galactosidase